MSNLILYKVLADFERQVANNAAGKEPRLVGSGIDATASAIRGWAHEQLLDELTLRLRSMKRGDPLYKLLKQELSALGHWKNLPRYQGSVANFEGKKQS